jgi:hypothetical protein
MKIKIKVKILKYLNKKVILKEFVKKILQHMNNQKLKVFRIN